MMGQLGPWRRLNHMNSDSDRELTLFNGALKVAPQERQAFLQRMCGGDEDLRRRLEALVSAHDRLGNFLEEPPTGGPSIEAN